MKKPTKKKYIPLILLLLISGLVFSQNTDFEKVELLLNNGENAAALHLLKKLNDNKISKYSLGKKHYYLAKAYSNSNLDDLAFDNYLSAKKIFKSIDSINLAMEINLDLAFMLSAINNNKKESQKYIDEYLTYAITSKDKNKIAEAFVQFASMKINTTESDESLFYFYKAKTLNKEIKNEKLESKINNNLGVLYSEVLKNYDSGMFYYNRDLEYLKKNYNPNDVFYNYANRAGNYYHLKEHKQAIELLKTADTIKVTDFQKANKRNLNYFLFLNYDALGDTQNALKSLKIFMEYDNSLNEEEMNLKISDLQTKYQTKEKEIENKILKNENSLLESKRKTNQLVSYSLVLTLIFIVAFSFLFIKNLRKKQLISEKEKQLEQQKLATLLKEHELQNIDLMIESQEKERSRLANELHDNLGSMLATLKINFQNLKRQKESLVEEENKLFEKTDSLIEEAYQKVRDLAHFKNLGVIGNEGLVPAVKKMADKMSVMNLLEIHVIPFGLKDRLDNNLEVSIFRMIQELCTNIIKHAVASEVNIYLTQHNGTDINLIIEDNGVGFDYKSVKLKDGMGLKNIEKKVEQMGGTFSIDSIPEKGTTIIIDIPL